MAINFPDSPSVNDTHTVGDKTWVWDGTVWSVVVGAVPTTVSELTISNDLTVDGDATVYGNLLTGLDSTLSVGDSHTLIPDPASATFENVTVYSGLTVPSGDFTVDTSTLHVDSTNNRVGVGTTTPTAKLHVKGAAANDTSPEMTIQGNGSMSFHGSLGQGSFNGIVNAGDMGIIFTDGTQGTGEFVIAPWASGTGGMRIDSSGNTSFGGYVSQPRAFFRAYRRGNQGWSLTGTQTIVFEYTVFNSGNNYDTTNGKFTAPVAGYYALGAHFFKYTSYTNSTNTYWGIFTSNGYSTTTNHGTQGQDGGQSLSCIVFMGAGDSADVQITSAGSTIQSYGTMSFNSFYGYLLSA
ncbi:MAG: C1q-like domain-containing protein [Ilumatobacteraceae bacterium]